jgi:hypothetical protein
MEVVMPKPNMSMLDRALRAIVGVFLIALFFALPDLAWRWVFWIGLVPLATAAVGYCPAYPLIGWQSKPKTGDRARA